MAQKKPTDNTAYNQLKKDISAGTLGRLYVLHGEEAYLRDYYLGRMKELFVGQGMEDFNLHALSGKDLTIEALEQAVDALPMMSERTMVLVSDLEFSRLGDNQRETLTELLSQLPDYCCVIFLQDVVPYKLDARTKLALTIKEHGSVVEFVRQGQGDLVDWVHRRVKALGKEIDSEQASYLIFLCGDLMNSLIGEIEKVCAYAQGSRITRADIDTVATPQLDAVVFHMTDAIGKGNFDQAAHVLGELFQMQEPAERIMYSISRQIRQLYSARLLMEQRGTAGELAELWSIKSYPAKILMDNARRFSLAWCRKAVAACAKTEIGMRSTGTVDKKEQLTALLLELSKPAERK